MDTSLPHRVARPFQRSLVVVLSAVAVEQMMIGVGTVVTLPRLLVWIPVLGALGPAVLVCRAVALGSKGDLRSFWRRMTLGLVLLSSAAVSQATDVATTADWTGVPPLSNRTLLVYVAAVTVLAVALLWLPLTRRSRRQLVTTYLDVAIVLVGSAVAASQYLRWSPTAVGTSASGWLDAAILVIAAAGVLAVIRVMVSGHGSVPRVVLWVLAPAGSLGPVSVLFMALLAPWPHLNGSAAVLPLVGLLFVLAARVQVLSSATGTPGRTANAARVPGRDSAVPLVVVALTGVLLAVYLSSGRLSPMVLAGSAALLILLVVRQAYALGDQAILLRRVAHDATHDALTGLANRRAFTSAIEAPDAATSARTVLLLDLKDFGAINNGLGSSAGDALLIAYGHRLLAAAGPDAVVARLGGDGFGVLLPTAHSEPVLAQLQTASREPVSVNGYDILVETSIGVAAQAAGPVSDLFRRAEVALRAAMAAGGHHAVHYDEALDREATVRATLAAELRRGLDTGEFHLVYQPVVNLSDGRMVAVESLIRWTRPDGRTVSPAEFIPVAEDTGMIVEMGAWVIDAACAQAAAWQRRYGADAPAVNVNVSARQLLDPALPEAVAGALARHGVCPHRITVELTETAVFGGGPALATVRKLAQLGVTIALDDFGTGHSSLGLLRTCPVDVLKVDKSFIDGLNGTPQQEAIAVSLASIASTLGLLTVAEGVESAAQVARLAELGYDHAQGFHLSRPVPPATIDALLSGTRPGEITAMRRVAA